MALSLLFNPKYMRFACKLRPFLGQNSRGIVRQQLVIPRYLLDRTVPAETVLAKLTEEDSARLKVIETEHRILIDQGAKVPSSLDPAHLLELLCCTSVHSRNQYYAMLFKKEMRRLNSEPVDQFTEHRIETERASSSRIIRMIDDRYVRAHQESWMFAEMRCPESAQRLIFDFTFESEMRLQDMKSCAQQMNYILMRARTMRPHPFLLTLCGLRPNTNQYAYLTGALGLPHKVFPQHKLEDLPWDIRPNDFTKEFPLQDPSSPIIYLTPNAPRSFQPGEWDHNAMYVIGGIVDKVAKFPVTWAKARRTGVQSIRLPLERYMKWAPGKSKTMTLNCIFSILASAKETNGDWEYALRENIPRRMYDQRVGTSKKLSELFSKI